VDGQNQQQLESKSVAGIAPKVVKVFDGADRELEGKESGAEEEEEDLGEYGGRAKNWALRNKEVQVRACQ
jgi:hypothetical protein